MSEVSLLSIKQKLYNRNKFGNVYQDPDARLDADDIAFLTTTHSIRGDVHRMCVNCQARQIIKYLERPPTENASVSEDDPDMPKTPSLDTNTFHVDCDFFKPTLPAGAAQAAQVMATANDTNIEDARKIMRATVDPVAWCELMFGFDDKEPRWRLRNYQKEQLRCTSRRMAIRAGRRSGKTFAMALKLIYLAFNMRVDKGIDRDTGKRIIVGPSILVVTPYQAQIANIFKEIESILKRNVDGDLLREVTTGTAGSLYVKTPYHRMEMLNGASISGFVSGVGVSSDGSGGGTMRGQTAHVIYIDEMDMVQEDVLDKVIKPILLSDENVILIATSTPIGKRGWFYKWCLDDIIFKEDYLPSTLLPQWDKNEAFFRGQSSEENFRAEYLAEFIDGQYGVFKPSLVYEARRDFSYDQTHRMSPFWRTAGVKNSIAMKTVIGIDWNKNAGTEYVVAAYDYDTGNWFVVEARNVPHSEFSSVGWKEEVKRLNFKWKPDYIYADAGYGHTIIEDLLLEAHELKRKQKKTAEELETCKITERMVIFDFKKNVELRSPVDGSIIEKPGKNFLVENAIRVFEEKRLWFPESDKVLLNQLLGYRVLRRSAIDSKPIYGPDSEKVGDHRLDALMLALGGLTLQFSVYSRSSMPVSEPGLASVDKENEGGWAPDIARQQQAAIARAVGGGTGPSMLAIVRGHPGEGKEVDRLIKAKLAAQRGERTAGPTTYGGRQELGKANTQSPLEAMMAGAYSSRGYDLDNEMLYNGETSGFTRRTINKGGSRKITRRSV
jgi:hypothetical protein